MTMSLKRRRAKHDSDVLKLPKREVERIMGSGSEIRDLNYAGIPILNSYLVYPSRGYNRSAPGLHQIYSLRAHAIY